jgi:hypothetical protein
MVHERNGGYAQEGLAIVELRSERYGSTGARRYVCRCHRRCGRSGLATDAFGDRCSAPAAGQTRLEHIVFAWNRDSQKGRFLIQTPCWVWAPAWMTRSARRGSSTAPSMASSSSLYLEKVLAPTLAKGEVVILDNLGSHKGKSARDVIRIRGAHLLFLPPRIPITNTSAARSSSSTGWCSIARR